MVWRFLVRRRHSRNQRMDVCGGIRTACPSSDSNPGSYAPPNASTNPTTDASAYTSSDPSTNPNPATNRCINSNCTDDRYRPSLSNPCDATRVAVSRGAASSGKLRLDCHIGRTDPGRIPWLTRQPLRSRWHAQAWKRVFPSATHPIRCFPPSAFR